MADIEECLYKEDWAFFQTWMYWRRMAQKYKEELFLEWLRSSSESGCIKKNVASKEDFCSEEKGSL